MLTKCSDNFHGNVEKPRVFERVFGPLFDYLALVIQVMTSKRYSKMRLATNDRLIQYLYTVCVQFFNRLTLPYSIVPYVRYYRHCRYFVLVQIVVSSAKLRASLT
jgi:hypothetical protein